MRDFKRRLVFAAAFVLAATGASAERAEDHGADLHRFDPTVHAVFKGLHHPNTKLPHLLKRDYAAAFDYYSRNDFKPLWHDADRKPNTRAIALATLFERAGEHGLDPMNYPVFLSADGHKTARDLATADILLTLSVLEYGRHAASGQVSPEQVSSAIDQKPNLPDPIAILTDAAEGTDPVAALEALHPQHPQYLALKAALAVETAPKPEKTYVKIPDDRTLKRGVSDPRVAVLRARLGILNAATANDYDDEVREAVKIFQGENGLTQDGIAGPRTLAALNGETNVSHVDTLTANMERWRWMPRDLGDRHVFVNIPHFQVQVIDHGAVSYQGRVVVGKTRHMTPVFSDEMEHVVVNPYWNVPRSIARNEILPRLRNNPGYGYKYEIIHASGSRVDPYMVNWGAYSGGSLPFRFRQPPGPRNALGSVKFLFPNKHSVYLHDTPSRSLFARTERAFSHGCVRLHEPMAFAEALLVDEPDWDVARMKRMMGGRESWINLTSGKRAVHLAYFTAWAGENGEMSYRRDIYGHDRRTLRAIDR